jgi:hypothetical protein
VGGGGRAAYLLGLPRFVMTWDAGGGWGGCVEGEMSVSWGMHAPALLNYFSWTTSPQADWLPTQIMTGETAAFVAFYVPKV